MEIPFNIQEAAWQKAAFASSTMLLTILILSILLSVIVGFILLKKKRRAIQDNPANYGLAYKDVSFLSGDEKTMLKGWLMEPEHEAILTVIMSHGYGGNRHEDNVGFLPLSNKFIERGYRVLLFDYRNAGESEGSFTTVGAKEKYDLLGAIDWIKESTDEPIVLYGISMGASTSLLAASMTDDVIGVIADSPFSDLEAYLSINMPVWTKLPTFPFTQLILNTIPIIAGLNIKEASPLSVLEQVYPTPVLFIHGQEDPFIPFTESVKMYETHPDKFELWLPEGTKHVKGFKNYPVPYFQKVTAFIEKAYMSNNHEKKAIAN